MHYINKECKNNSSLDVIQLIHQVILSYETQIKYLMTIFLSVLFSDLLLNNKGLESHDPADLDEADSNNFR